MNMSLLDTAGKSACIKDCPAEKAASKTVPSENYKLSIVGRKGICANSARQLPINMNFPSECVQNELIPDPNPR